MFSLNARIGSVAAATVNAAAKVTYRVFFIPGLLRRRQL